MHISSTIAAAGLAFVLSFPAAAFGAPADPEVWAKVNSAGTYLHGRLDAKGDNLALTEESGELHELDPAAIISIDFESLRPADEAEPLRDGALRSPWKTATVGQLPRGGVAKVKDGRIIIETSSAEQGTPFGSFFTAYRPMPNPGASSGRSRTR